MDDPELEQYVSEYFLVKGGFTFHDIHGRPLRKYEFSIFSMIDMEYRKKQASNIPRT